MGFWTSSRSFSLRKISLDQKLEIFMSTFSSKKTKWIQQPPTSKVVEWNNSRDPPRIIEKFHEMITEELFNIIWQHSDNHDDLSFIQFPKKDIFVWPQKHINLKIPRCIGMRYRVLALHESCNDVSRYLIDSSSYDFSMSQSVFPWNKSRVM